MYICTHVHLLITKNAPYVYACGSFHGCAFTRFQKPQQLGRVWIARLSIVVQRAQQAGPDLSGQRCCGKLRLKPLLVLAKRLENCSSSSSVQGGWSARMATRWSSHRPACSMRYQSPHVSSSANDSFKKFTGAHSRRPHHSHFLNGRQNRRSSFCSGRGEILVTIARFGKHLFANMHHRVHAVAGALRKPNVACPHPDVSTGWPLM